MQHKFVVNMTIKSISAPYNMGQTVEVTWEAERNVGEGRTFRAEFAPDDIAILGLEVGQLYAVPFYHLRPLFSAMRPVRSE